jgi:transcription termination/antitermination protein NusG
MARYFALQVAARGEARFLRLAEQLANNRADFRVLWPRRSLRVRRRGVSRDVLQPLFPGYLFVVAPDLDTDLHAALRQLPGFVRYLPNDSDVRPLSEKDARLISSLVLHGEIVRKSLVTFDENSRINIIEGPLKGLEGLIVKVDRRKGRAKVKLDLYDVTHLVDFGFTSISRNDKPPGTAS